MSQLRQDPTTKEWVILSTHRAGRPHVPKPMDRPPLAPHDPECPFCPGNEDQTPPEVVSRPGPDGWEQRVVPNMFAALEPGGSTERHGDDAAFRQMGGLGSHEVVIESPLHHERMDEMPVERLASVIGVWRERYRSLKREPWVSGVIVFKNFGTAAGTSLVHPHSQIVATPVFPPDALRRYAVATRYWDDTGHCVYDDLLEAEVKSGERIVTGSDGFVALEPFAARVPFETWLFPRDNQTSFGHLDDHDLPALAGLLREVLGALRVAAGDPDYNVVVHSAPVGEEWKPFFRWHLRLVPRTATAAGFELGSGMFINTMAPEECAELMRSAAASS